MNKTRCNRQCSDCAGHTCATHLSITTHSVDYDTLYSLRPDVLKTFEEATPNDSDVSPKTHIPAASTEIRFPRTAACRRGGAGVRVRNTLPRLPLQKTYCCMYWT
jgi:hypothetical protein